MLLSRAQARALSYSLVGAATVRLLAGCVSYQPEPISPANTLAEFSGRTLAEPGLRGFWEKHLDRQSSSWPPASWDFQTLTLVAFHFHPSLDVARAGAGPRRAG
jgi:cobalt-zinc-cadmium efflux system outer membrane protein